LLSGETRQTPRELCGTICMSDEMYRVPGSADLLAPMRCDAHTVRVKGIERAIAVHALRARR